VRVRACSLSTSSYNCWMDNLRPGGAIRWKVKTAGWEGRGVVCEKPTPPTLQPLPVSIKGRWVGPREQVLNVPIACLIGWLRRETGYGPVNHSARLGIVLGSPLSVAGQGTLSSDSFHVPDISLVPDLTM
jgi:hypothetical protein